MRNAGLAVLVVCALTSICLAQGAPPGAQGGDPIGHFPFLDVDVKARQVRVECEALHCKNPLEFFLCESGTNEHESVLRSKVRPSHLHAALLMLGLKPGEPVRYSEAAKRWLPPRGAALAIWVQFEKDGKQVILPANRLMRDVNTHRTMPPMTWVFAGSRIMPSGSYAADQTGYLVSIVNFDLTVIDVPELASSANETLEWETNLDVMPPVGAKVIMIVEPAAGAASGAATGVATTMQAGQTADQTAGDAKPTGPIDQMLVRIDAQGKIELSGQSVDSPAALVDALKMQNASGRRVRVAVANPIEQNPMAREAVNALSAARIRFVVIPQADALATTRPASANSAQDGAQEDPAIQRLLQQWNQSVAPHGKELQDAAEAHARIIAGLREQQQTLIDKADHIQRLIDQLEKQYQQMVTPPTQ